MFKLEEARKEAERILEETSKKVERDITTIQGKTDGVYTAISAIDTKAQSFIKDKEEMLNSIILNYETRLKGLEELEKVIQAKAAKPISRKPKSSANE